MDLIVNINPNSVLDIGTGFGKYGLLCREYLELWDGRQNYDKFLRRIDGVEAFESYITPLHKFVYDNLYTRDISKLADNLDFSYDLVLLIDVLEHFDKAEGRSLLTKILARNKGVLISTPKYPSNQKDAFNNIYEIHRARWTKQEISRLYSNTAYDDNDDDTDSSNGINAAFFLRDKTHLITYIGRRENINKLKRRLLLRQIKKVPGTSYFIPKAVRFMKSVGLFTVFLIPCCQGGLYIQNYLLTG
jgi:hypothetical protein